MQLEWIRQLFAARRSKRMSGLVWLLLSRRIAKARALIDAIGRFPDAQ